MELLELVPANNTLFAGTTNKKLDFSFFSLLYGMAAPSAERQHPEAWPASNYRHLRGFQINKELLTISVPVNKELLTGTVPVNMKLLTGILLFTITACAYYKIKIFENSCGQ